MTIRKIIYVTGTRADYGLMRNALKYFEQSEDIDLSLCVTGMHLHELYGKTVEEIQQDGFKICAQVSIDVTTISHGTMSKAIGQAIIGFTEVFLNEKPDIVLILGDRGEMLAAAIAAVHLNIPIVHLHGGERSGTVDEMVRHSISKLSHYHFVATKESKERLIKMGEFPDRIHVVGAPGLDEVKNHKPVSREAFCQQYNFSPDKKVCLLVYHPVVQEVGSIKEQFKIVIKAAVDKGFQIICLEPNSDTGGHLIREAIADLSAFHQIRIIKHLHRKDYLDCLYHADVMLGNSSSGIIEAASFNLPVVNVGSRQNLRERSNNVIDVTPDYAEICSALNSAADANQAEFLNCYGDGNTSDRCYQLLRSISLDPYILSKTNAY